MYLFMIACMLVYLYVCAMIKLFTADALCVYSLPPLPLLTRYIPAILTFSPLQFDYIMTAIKDIFLHAVHSSALNI